MERTRKLPLGIALLFVVSIVLSFLCFMPKKASAAGNMFTATDKTSLADIKAIIAGTKKNEETNTAYDGILFVSGTYSYASGGAYIAVPRAFIFETAAGAIVTFNDGFQFTMTTSSDVIFRGSGEIRITNPVSSGLFANAAKPNVKMQSGRLIIDSTKGYGMYLRAGSSFEMTGGYLQVSNCANASTEGGIDFEGTKFEMTGGELKTFENGGTSSGGFGELYFSGGATLTFGGDAIVSLSSARAPQNIIVVTGSNMLVTGNAVVSIDAKGSVKRGINGANQTGDYAGTSLVTVSNGGTLNINSSTSNATSGIRRCMVTVNNATLNIKGFSYGMDASHLRAQTNAKVTALGSTRDMGISLLGTAVPVIDSGSVQINPATSVVNGVLTTLGTGKLSSPAVNTAGEALTRFDIPGLSNTSFTIAADPADAAAKPAYTYSIKANHAGTAYVWAPAVKVVFWPSEASYTAFTTSDIVKTNYTIRGAAMGFVGGSAPADPVAPAGQVFTGWVDAQTKQKVDVSAAAIHQDINLVPVFATLYTAEVVSGGALESAAGPKSAIYTAAEKVTVVADAPAEGMKFVRWEEVTSAGIGFANTTAATTTFSMPAANVQVRAVFEKASYGYVVHFKDTSGNTILADKTGTEKYGTTIAAADFKADISGYTYENATPGSVVVGADASKNAMTLYYTKLAEPTTQTFIVNYVSLRSGRVLHARKTSTAIIGSTVTAKSQIISITGYTYDSASTASILIGTDASKNVITLYYANNSKPTDGETQPSPSPTASPLPSSTQGPEIAPSALPSVVPSESVVPSPAAIVEPEAQEPIEYSKSNPKTAEEWKVHRQETFTAIKEEGVPILSIAGIDIPLSGGGIVGIEVWALFNLMCVLIAAIIGVWQLICALRINKKDDSEANTETKDSGRAVKILRIISILAAPLALLVFLLTENMRQLMVMFDGRSLPMAILLVAQTGIIAVARIIGKRLRKEQ